MPKFMAPMDRGRQSLFQSIPTLPKPHFFPSAGVCFAVLAFGKLKPTIEIPKRTAPNRCSSSMTMDNHYMFNRDSLKISLPSPSVGQRGGV